MSENKLTHLNTRGEARMVDIGDKKDTVRIAVASGRIRLSEELWKRLKENSLAKGDALAAARIAGIQAAKRTAELIPLCHSLPLAAISIDIELEETPPSVSITATVKTFYKTGVEMEALTAVSAAALTIYDMGKSVDRGMIIEQIKLENKSGGKSGNWHREVGR
jgi:cyclic pyranopterin phosphate synthase